MSEVYLLDTNIISALGDPANAGREAAAERFMTEEYVKINAEYTT